MQIPALVDATRYLTQYKYTGGDFKQDSDTILWSIQGYDLSGGPTNQPAITVTATLNLNFSGASSGQNQLGIKWTASSTGNASGLITPYNTFGRQVGVKVNLQKSSGNFVTFGAVVLLAGFGVKSSGQSQIALSPGDLFASAEFGRLTDGTHSAIGQGINTWHQFQFGFKNDQSEILNINDVDF